MNNIVVDTMKYLVFNVFEAIRNVLQSFSNNNCDTHPSHYQRKRPYTDYTMVY
jgi:hypothetical protein